MRYLTADIASAMRHDATNSDLLAEYLRAEDLWDDGFLYTCISTSMVETLLTRGVYSMHDQDDELAEAGVVSGSLRTDREVSAYTKADLESGDDLFDHWDEGNRSVVVWRRTELRHVAHYDYEHNGPDSMEDSIEAIVSLIE